MTWLPLYTLLLAAGTALCAGVAVAAWRHRPTPGATPLAGLSVGAAIWAFATLAQVVADGYAVSLFWGRVVYVGITLGGMCWFILTMEYSGKEQYLRPPVIGLLAIEPVLINALVWTNDAHRLVWTAVEPGGSVYGFALELGPAFWAHSAYSYALLAAGSLLVLGQLYRRRSIYRGQALAMFLGAVAPWVGNAIFLSGVTAADWAPIGFVVSSLALFWAMTTRSLVDVTPVARNTVLDRIPSGVAVVDRNDRVLDANAEMERLLGREYDRLVGVSADEAFAGWPALEDAVADREGDTHEIALATEGDSRYFDAEIEPLIDDLDRRIGRIALVHDVTEQRRRERELQRQNEQLDRFTEVLSHDLRNPLNVADGYLDIVEETGDLEHVGKIRSAHDRMGDLIEDVRTLVRHGQTISEVDRLDLADAAREAASNVDTRGADVRIEDDLGAVEADENRLLHAFENLFRNSIDHGVEEPVATVAESAGPATDGAGGRSDDAAVTITVGRLDDESTARRGFFVADDGPGVPADEREKIFESGYTTGDDGTGLGLAIVQNAIEAHGWEIAVAEGEKGGARFEVRGVPFVEE